MQLQVSWSFCQYSKAKIKIWNEVVGHTQYLLLNLLLLDFTHTLSSHMVVLCCIRVSCFIGLGPLINVTHQI